MSIYSHTTGDITDAYDGRQFRLVARDAAGNEAKSAPGTLLVGEDPGTPLTPFNMKKGANWKSAVPHVLLGNVWKKPTECHRKVGGVWIGEVCDEGPPLPPEPTITQQPINKTVNQGDAPAEFTIGVDPATTEIRWEHNDSYLGWTDTGHREANLSVPSTLSMNGAQYRVQVFHNGMPLLVSNTVTLTVNEVIIPPIHTCANPGGSELMPNGNWNNGLDGWVAVDGAVLSNPNGQMKIANKNGSVYVIAMKTFTGLFVGSTYEYSFSVVFKGGLSNAGCRLFVNSGNASGIEYEHVREAARSDDKIIRACFTSTHKTVVLRLRVDSSSASGYCTFDNASLKRI